MLRLQGFQVSVIAEITRIQAIAVILSLDGAGSSTVCYGPAVAVAQRLGIKEPSEALIAAIQSPYATGYPAQLDFSPQQRGSLIAADIFLLDWGVANVRFTRAAFSERCACEVVVAFDALLKQPHKGFLEFRDQLLAKLRHHDLTESPTWSEMPTRDIFDNQEDLDAIPNMQGAEPPSPEELQAARALANMGLRREFIELKRGKSVGGSFLGQMRKAGLLEEDGTDGHPGRPSALGRRLADGSHWMRILAVSSLLDEGVPTAAIRVPVDDGNDENDLVFTLGDVFVCELKDEHFHEGHAKKFAARIFAMNGITALVISSGSIAPEARDYLDLVITRQGPNLAAPYGSRGKQVRFLEGDTSVTRKLRDLVRAKSADAIASEFRVDGTGRGYDISTILTLRLIPIKDLVEEYAKTPDGAALIQKLMADRRTNRQAKGSASQQ